MALKKSPLNAGLDPACFFTHWICINMLSTAPEKRTKSPRKKRRGRRRGKGRKGETRQSPGWLFSALLIVWDFSLALFATPHHYSAQRQQAPWRMSCRIGVPRCILQEVDVRGRRNRGSEGPVQEWKAGMQKAEAMLNQVEQLHWYENAKWEQGVGRKYRKKQPEAPAPWTASSASWWLLICHPREGQRSFPKVICHNLCKRS